MRPIKFRGRRVNNGGFVFGDVAYTAIGVLMNGWEVDPESVAQLVGYDSDGNEVYEGDTVIKDFHGTPYEYQAQLKPRVQNIHNGVFSYDIDQTTLKQEAKS